MFLCFLVDILVFYFRFEFVIVNNLINYCFLKISYCLVQFHTTAVLLSNNLFKIVIVLL